jgi:hydroxymethylglutaryl-CoA reductase
LNRGGFQTKIIGTEKVGQVHFIFKGDFNKLNGFFNNIKSDFYGDTSSITKNMEKRGGGIKDIVLRDLSDKVENYYQLHSTFETLDAMGANFINSCLEQFAKTLKQKAAAYPDFTSKEKEIENFQNFL